MDYPLISVCIITYNHEKFILDCLKGVFCQEYPNIEVVISNDFSLDKTHHLISEFISNNRREGIVFRYYNQDKNLGTSKNFLYSLKKCSGDFIAICEGDDFWFNESYLSNHYKFLSVNKEYTFSISNVTYLEDGSKTTIDKVEWISKPPVKMDIDISMVGRGFHLGVQSLMLKSSVELFKRLNLYIYLFDTSLIVELLNLGKGRSLETVGSMYRIQPSGLMSGSSPFFRIRFNFLLFFEIVQKNKKVSYLKGRALFLASEYYLAIFRFSEYRYLKEFFIISLSKFITIDFSWRVFKSVLYNTISMAKRNKIFQSNR